MMNFNATEIAVIGTLGGAFIAGLFSALTVFINKKSEEKRHLRELVIKTASDHWKHVAEISSATKMPPLSTYIVNTVQMCDLALNKKLTPETVRKKLEESSSVMDVMLSHSAEISKKKSDKNGN